MKAYLYRILMVVLIVLVSCVKDEPTAHSVIEVGDRVPDFSITMNDGTILTTDMLRGKESMIVFFTTECGDCRRELPRINAYALAHPEIEIVCIARSQNEKEIEIFWQLEGLTLPYSPQSNAAVYNMFATSGVPRIYCVDSRLYVTAVYFEEFPLL